MNLIPQCMRDNEYWRSVCPLICYYIVEYHLPNRVMRQFGILQSCPPEYINTSHELHGYGYLFSAISFYGKYLHVLQLH